jgi:hypothetical protein
MTDIRSELKKKLGMDLVVALKELGLPQVAFERVVRISLRSTAETLKELEIAIESGNRFFISNAGHELKGVYLNLRFQCLVDPILEMNELLKTGASMEDIRQQLEIFKAKYLVLKDIFK